MLSKTDIVWLHKDTIKPMKDKISLGEVFLKIGQKDLKTKILAQKRNENRICAMNGNRTRSS